MFTFFQASNSRKSEIRFDFGRVELPLNLFKGNDGDIGISDLSRHGRPTMATKFDGPGGWSFFAAVSVMPQCHLSQGNISRL